MVNVNNFIFYKDWYDKLVQEIEDEELRKDFAWRIIKYGITGELDLIEGNGFANAWLKSITDTVSRNKSSYASKVEYGTTAGRKPSFDREQLKILIAEGRSAKEIAIILGVTADAIYHDQIWKDRKKNNLYK